MSSSSKQTGRLILIPVDDTEASQQSLDWALENLYRNGDEFYFLHVVTEVQPSSSLLAGMIGVNSALMIGREDEEQQEHRVDEARAMLDHKYVAKAKAAGARQRIEIVLFNTSSESVGQIVTMRAKELDASVVVITSHNRSSLAGFFIGSVSQFVTKNCPVTSIILH